VLNLKTDWQQSDPLAILNDAVDQPTANQFQFLQQSGNVQLMPDISPNLFLADTREFVIDAFSPKKKPIDLESPQNALSGNGGMVPIPLTDKASTGVFESMPFVRSTSVMAQPALVDYGTEGDTSFKGRDANQIDPDQVVMNDPGAMALQTWQTSASPLQTTLTGDSAYYSGTDPLPVTSQDMTQEPSYDERKPSDCGMFDFPCKWKSVNQEVYLFIIGAIVLAIGVYALTR
jgi:hypothetical protein